MTQHPTDTLQQIIQLLNPQRRILAVTGAGMSADSGLPTYRGVGGLYNSGETEQGRTIEQLLSGQTFRSQPNLTWKYLGQIGAACAEASCNRGHQVLAEMESHFASFCILTQNIDGFHVQAGSKNVIEIHGNLHRLRCERCGFRKTVETFAAIEIPPVCESCGGMLRPDVVLFDEMLLPDACDQLTRQWRDGFDMVLSIGTTSVFPYIAEPVLHCHDTGKPAVEINPTETQVSRYCMLRLPMSATTALAAIWAGYQESRNAGSD